MKPHAIAMAALRWAVGLVALLESLHFALSGAEAAHFARTGLPMWLRPALGWSEAMSSALFLAPRATLAGGYGLLLSFAAALAIHLEVRDYQVGALMVYGTAVVACLTYRADTTEKRPHEFRR